jgi:hypothetical protein
MEAIRLSGLHVLLPTLYEPLDRLAPIPHTGADSHKVRWLPKEPAPPDRRDGNAEELCYLVFS